MEPLPIPESLDELELFPEQAFRLTLGARSLPLVDVH
jgi:hypothetical protein